MSQLSKTIQAARRAGVPLVALSTPDPAATVQQFVQAAHAERKVPEHGLAVTSVRSCATHYWRTQTVAYPEPGIRLIRREKIDAFNTKMIGLKQELTAAAAELQAVYDELRHTARENLGHLFNVHDYPSCIASEFWLGWEYPSIEPPAYLRELNPALYEQEQQRIAARFDEAMRMTEEALTAELAEIVGHLCDKLAGVNDGQPKQLRAGALDNLQNFFARFGELNIRSNEQLDRLVATAEQAIAGVEIDALKADMGLRASVSENIGQVRTAIEAMVIERPKRSIRLADDEDANAGSPTTPTETVA